MKNTIKNYCLLFMVLVAIASCTSVDTGIWTIRYNNQDKSLDITKNDSVLLKGLYASYRYGDKLITTKNYTTAKLKTKEINNNFGKVTAIQLTYTADDLPTLEQSFYIIPGKDYLLTEFSLISESEEIQSNYMAPINVDDMLPLLPINSNRALFVPYDNDMWVRYQSHPLDFKKLTSYEVTAYFNNESRNGIVIGSVEHDNWKTAIEMTPRDNNHLKTLTCYGGVADKLTRDSKSHGSLKGTKIKSPLIFLGSFADWRSGLEQYADVNAVVAPPKAWNKDVPFGWNSWGALQFSLTYQKALEVSDFYKNELQNNNFYNTDNTVYIGLDSGWNRFTEEELKSFVERCKANGQIAAIYWTPFTDWGKRPEKTIKDATEYKYKDIYLYANGKPQELDGAYAIDPTHPAIEAQMKATSELFRRCGYEYVKMDFMTHGAMEADSWYKPEIQTGTQAYNYGMELLNKYFGDMYLNLSISPIFPAQYAQSRRIACDAWNLIKDTEYTMNAVSYGWWIDRVYQYNDADHVVLRDATEGENRARVTSAVITGLYIGGDDFSAAGPEDVKKRAKTFFTNKDINLIANGVSFRPVEGNGAASEKEFIRKDKDTLYYVIFNYTENELSITVPFERIGLKASEKYTAHELWSGESLDLQAELTVPAKDVKVIRIK